MQKIRRRKDFLGPSLLDSTVLTVTDESPSSARGLVSGSTMLLPWGKNLILRPIMLAGAHQLDCGGLTFK